MDSYTINAIVLLEMSTMTKKEKTIKNKNVWLEAYLIYYVKTIIYALINLVILNKDY